METLLYYSGYYLAGINAITFLLFGYDKWMARGKGWRVPEALLWFFAAIGGSAGALAGMKFFRHKTRKASFQLVIGIILLLQAGAGYLIYTYL